MAMIAERRKQPFHTQVPQRVRSDELPDLVNGHPRTNQLLAGREIDPVKTGMGHGRAGYPHVHLPCARLAQTQHAPAGRRSPHDRVIHHHNPLVAHHFLENGQLHVDTLGPVIGFRHNERAADVMVPDETVIQGNTAAARVSQGSAVSAVGHGYHDVGLDGVLLGQPHAVGQPHRMDIVAEDAAIRPCEVDQFKHALCAEVVRRFGKMAAVQTRLIRDNQFAGLHVPQILGARLHESAGFAREDVPLADPADTQRLEPQGITGRHHAVGRHDQKRKSALELPEGARYALRPNPKHRVGQQVDQDFAVRAGLENRPGLLVAAPQLGGIDKIPVVRHGPDAVNAFHHQRLYVLYADRTRRRITNVTDAEVPGKVGAPAIGEDLVEEPLPLVGADLLSVAHDDSRAFLPAMLQSEKPPKDRCRGAVNPVDTAQTAGFPRVFRALLMSTTVHVRTQGIYFE